MAKLNYNEIKEKKIIIYNSEPYEVIDSHVARKQANKPQNQTKLKSLISGKTVSVAFHASDTAEQADIERRDVKFLYHNRGEFWFCSPNDPKNRFKLDESIIGDKSKFFKENSIVVALVWDNGDEEKIIQIDLPIKVEFEVKEAPPAVKGNTAQGGNKVVTLENGTTINTPMFINPGDIVVVNTEKGEYVERKS